MGRIILVLLFVLAPAIACGSTAGDFTVNSQQTYAVPPGSAGVLILDLTLPKAPEGKTLQLKSIKIHNAGTIQQADISQLSIFEDEESSGWNGDERETVRISSSPFFETDITSENFSQYSGRQRIFVTVNIASATAWEKTIKPQLELNSVVFSSTTFNGPTNTEISGFERTILPGASAPSVPLSPLAKKGEAISTSTIRWYFMDLSNNEFGFKIFDSKSKLVAQKDEAGLSYLDETGLQPDTEYSGRRVVAFNDQGQSPVSTLTVFPAVRTQIEETPAPTSTEVSAGKETSGPLSASELRVKIQEVQQKIIDLLNQLIQLLQQQISGFQASLYRAFEIFISWFE